MENNRTVRLKFEKKKLDYRFNSPQTTNILINQNMMPFENFDKVQNPDNNENGFSKIENSLLRDIFLYWGDGNYNRNLTTQNWKMLY